MENELDELVSALRQSSSQLHETSSSPRRPTNPGTNPKRKSGARDRANQSFRRNGPNAPFFVPDEEGDAAAAEDGGENACSREWFRAPNDPNPYKRTTHINEDETQTSEDEGECFPSTYMADKDLSYNRNAMWGMDENMWTDDMRSAYDTIVKFIQENFSCNMRNQDLIENVYKYYHEEIRSNYPDLPAWTRKSIYNFIFHYSDTNESDERQVRDFVPYKPFFLIVCMLLHRLRE